MRCSMQRFAMKELINWKNKRNRKPLIIMGARQVGKTWLMKEFGKTYYSKTAYISFYNNNRMKQVFDMDFDIQGTLSLLSSLFCNPCDHSEYSDR